jgi:hypothetical protein
MSTAYVVVTILAAAWVGYSAAALFFRAKWVVQALTDYSVPHSWWPWLGTASASPRSPGGGRPDRRRCYHTQELRRKGGNLWL